jgi:hypothetical protein
MNRETFLDTLRTQYREDIREAYIESVHQRKVDFAELSSKLQQLMKTAHLEGLPIEDFDELTKSILPDAVIGQLELQPISPAIKKAA